MPKDTGVSSLLIVVALLGLKPADPARGYYVFDIAGVSVGVERVLGCISFLNFWVGSFS